MCMICGMTQAPVCGTFGPCGPFLQQMIGTALIAGGAGLAMLRVGARRVYASVMHGVKRFVYARYGPYER